MKCKYWEKNHTCKFGKLCTFAHGKRELRTKDNNLLEAMKNNFYVNMGKLGNNYNDKFSPYNINQNPIPFPIPLFHNSYINNNFLVHNQQNIIIENTVNNKIENNDKKDNEQDKNSKIFNINNGLFNFPIQ